MKVIYNKLIPFKPFAAINLFGFVFARKEYKPLYERTLNHERIHTEQMKEANEGDALHLLLPVVSDRMDSEAIHIW